MRFTSGEPARAAGLAEAAMDADGVARGQIPWAVVARMVGTEPAPGTPGSVSANWRGSGHHARPPLPAAAAGAPG